MWTAYRLTVKRGGGAGVGVASAIVVHGFKHNVITCPSSHDALRELGGKHLVHKRSLNSELPATAHNFLAKERTFKLADTNFKSVAHVFNNHGFFHASIATSIGASRVVASWNRGRILILVINQNQPVLPRWINDMAKEIQLHSANFKTICVLVVTIGRWCGGGIAIHSCSGVGVQDAVVTAT